jgi:hypothetical protein
MAKEQITQLQAQLNDFDLATRTEALAELVALVQTGAVQPLPESGLANMHCHSFFSFNAYGHSPSSLAWLGRQHGFKLMGIVDFDVLDGVDEFLDACETVGVRSSAGIETRVFVPAYAAHEINSPGEPGVCYHMGIGFVSSTVPQAVAPILADLGQRAGQRNQDILARVNDYLEPVTIDYQRDVLPLAPARHPTERHMVLAYVQAAGRATEDPVTFWADKLDVAVDEMAAIMDDSPRFQNLIRARLMKRGGVGYVQPESGMFPSLDAFHEMIVACGALPCAAWLDGTTSAEQQIEDWLGFLVDRGVAALNIIPDRNWNVPDAQTRSHKVQNLHRVVELARQLDLPLNVGTEMNSFGQKQVDDFDVRELAPVRQAFLDGAHFIYGHTVMQRALGLGYQSGWAQSHLPARRERNEFYTQVGYRVVPGKEGIQLLQNLDRDLAPAGFLRLIPS